MGIEPPYRNRLDAGQWLATSLKKFEKNPETYVLALPRGGVPVAYSVAQCLDLPLDILTVRKIGAPDDEEFAIGSIASGGVLFLNEHLIHQLGIPPSEVDKIVASERLELSRRERCYREGRPFPDLTAKSALLVDDGIATGASMRAAVDAIKKLGVQKVIVAAPVGAREVVQSLATLVDEIYVPLQPSDFYAVGQWYVNFEQVDDQTVRKLLQENWNDVDPD